MKRIMNKVNLSAPSSTHSSRTSSETSLNNLALDELFNEKIEDISPNNPQDVGEIHDTIEAIEIEPNIPLDAQQVPDFYKQFTHKHPLGNLLLRLSTMNNELCKKMNLKNLDQPSLDEVCSRFVEATKLERNRNTSKVQKATSEIEASILHKELNFAAINAAIQPPIYFSPTSKIISAQKLQEAIKTFPSRSNQKFSGTSSGPNIIEFLQSMNTAQAIMQLSKKEFLQIMQKCVTGKVYTMVAEYISFDHSVSDLYHSLLTLYDTRMTSPIARRVLADYKAAKNQSLSKVQSHIMMLASRIASQIPAGPSRTSMYNIEANNALTRCLPPNSAARCMNEINTLSAKLQQNPSFIQTIQCLHKFADSIDQDIQQNGVAPSKSNYPTREFPKFKVNSVDKNNYNSRNGKISGKTYTKRSQNGRQPDQKGRNYSINALNYNNKQYDHPKQERSYNMNHSNSKNNKNQYFSKNANFKPKNGSKNALYCSLCGSVSHSAEMVCYKMKNAEGRIVQTVPSFNHCRYCFEHVNRKLYHPEEMCFNKKQKDRENAQNND
jgi:hypothetical protein